MAADSLLPLFHESNPEPAMSHFTESDDVLAELLGEAGVGPLRSRVRLNCAFLPDRRTYWPLCWNQAPFT